MEILARMYSKSTQSPTGYSAPRTNCVTASGENGRWPQKRASCNRSLRIYSQTMWGLIGTGCQFHRRHKAVEAQFPPASTLVILPRRFFPSCSCLWPFAAEAGVILGCVGSARQNHVSHGLIHAAGGHFCRNACVDGEESAHASIDGRHLGSSGDPGSVS
jgi:hypothetical protein